MERIHRSTVQRRSICQKIWKTQQWQPGKAVFTPIPKKDNVKECSNFHIIVHISQASKVMLKITQAKLHQYMNWDLPDVQAGFRKGRGTSNQTANICWIIEKAREFQKNIYFWFIDYANNFVGITKNCGKIQKRWEYQTTLPSSGETCMQVKKQQLTPNMEQQTGSKLGKEYIKAIYCHPAYLTYMQNTSWEMPG